MDPNLQDIYAGLSGFALGLERFELGHGAVLSQTYAHFMAPFLMAFSPAAPGKPHPTPWKAAKGGFGFDIAAELYLPSTCKLETIDRLNTVWWICALLRLRATTKIFVPVVSSEKFASIPSIKEEPMIWPMEIHTARLFPDESEHSSIIGTSELEWVAQNWEVASPLLANEDFSLALQAVDLSIWNSNPSLALVSVWGALERLFSPSKQELSFRVSANIASFLEPPGRERYKSFRQIKTLYDHRSKAAHGDGKSELAPYAQSFSIARRALVKMIEARYVPAKSELEAHLFGDLLGITAASPGPH